MACVSTICARAFAFVIICAMCVTCVHILELFCVLGCRETFTSYFHRQMTD